MISGSSSAFAKTILYLVFTCIWASLLCLGSLNAQIQQSQLQSPVPQFWKMKTPDFSFALSTETEKLTGFEAPLLHLGLESHQTAKWQMIKKPLPRNLSSMLITMPGTALPKGSIFCRLDQHLDRQGLPLRFRLGSLEDVNRLEGKPGW